MLFDIDDFKTINDEHGHLVGDRALQEVARVLRRRRVRTTSAIRYGGDEFVVLLSPCGRVEAEERRRSCRTPSRPFGSRRPMGGRSQLSMSAGVGVFPDDGETYERLLARADRRMYRDKARRKDGAPFELVEMPRRHDGDWTPRVSVGS